MNSSKSLIRRRRSVSEWQDIMHQFKQSGQTQETFCTEQSLALSTFCRWRQQLSVSSNAVPYQATGFVELSSRDESVAAPSVAPWDVELQLGADIILRLRQRC